LDRHLGKPSRGVHSTREQDLKKNGCAMSLSLAVSQRAKHDDAQEMQRLSAR